MKIPWGDLAFSAVTGLLVKKFLSGTPDLPPPVVRETFSPQPLAVYIERIVWSLTSDFDVTRIRAVRNFVAQHEPVIQDGYRTEVPPEEMARKVDELIKTPKEAALMSEETRMRALFGPPVPSPMQPSVTSGTSGPAAVPLPNTLFNEGTADE